MIKSILGGKSKNLCDVAYLLTLPLDKTFEHIGYWRVLINTEPNTTYTFSRENANRITVSGVDYLVISAYDDDSHNQWLNHPAVPGLCNKSATLTTGSDGKLWILFNKSVYNYWQKNLNPFGYIQLEKGSTATEYVPHELTSYKSIMKVSDGRFVTSFDERMPCKTKNLFSSSTEVGIPSSTKFDRSEKRLLEDGKWYVGLTGSNYYSRDSVIDYSIMENSVYIKWRSNGYSVAKCIYCEPSTTYSFTKKYSLIQGHSLGINVGFYTEDGTFISFKGETATPNFVFTTPENCKYITICISGTKFPNDNFGAGCFSDLQLVKGTTATDYVPYGYV